MRFIIGAISFLSILISPHTVRADEFIRGLIVNYSDFSYVSSIAVGFKYVYFGTTNGVIRYDFSFEKWGDPLTGIEGLTDQVIYDIRASYDDENIWVKTDDGIFKYSETFRRWDRTEEFPQPDQHNVHILPDPHYFAPWGYNYMPNGALVDDQGRIFQLTDIVKDNWTHLWIGTWGLGPAYADETSRMIELLHYGLLQPGVTAIVNDSGSLWMGGMSENAYRNGVTLYDRENNEFSFIETPVDMSSINDNVNDIAVDDYSAWVATDNGLLVIDKYDSTVTRKMTRSSGLPDNTVLSVLSTDSVVYIGTVYGLAILQVFDDSTTIMDRVLLPARVIRRLEKTDKNLWIGTDQGVYRYDFKTHDMGRLTAQPASQFGPIYDIENASGKIWIAGDELISIDLTTADVEVFPEYMQYGGINAIAIQDSILAVATGKGLVINFGGRNRRDRLFTIGDGLPSNDIYSLLFDGEYLWLGTDRGLTRFWYLNPRL